jgi:hypothetical protein
MNNNKIKTPHDFPSYLTGDVKIVTPAQEQLNELQRRVEMVRSESDTIKELYNEVAEQQNSTPEATNEAVDDIVADAVADGVKSIEPGTKEAAIAAAIVEIGLPGDQPKTAEQLEAIAAANIDSTEAVVSVAEQAGVDTDEVARELQEKEHERKIKPELFSDGIQLVDRKSVTRNYDGYIGGYDRKLYEEYREEAQDLMTIPEEQRLGTEIIDEFGEARRPIIDIELLDEEDIKDVQEQINLRKGGFNKIEELLLQVGSNGEHDIDGKELAHQVADIALKHDIIRPDNQERLTTIADLYISETDVRQMQQIDEAMHDSTIGKRYVTMATERVVGLAQYNVLCSGTVMVHSGDYIAITESGGLSPRSMREGNGAQSENTSSGGLIHFTGDSTHCFYGDSCFGITIDDVVKKTPYLFYEPGIVIDNNGQGHSNDRAGATQKRRDTWQQGMYGTSQRMSKVMLGRHGGDMPKFVQARLDSATTRAAEGLAGADIGIGERNNFSFAASEDKETAANYTYELSDDLFTICRMGDDGNVRAHVDTEIVFMPVSYKQVNFSEKNRELNEVGMGKYEFTLENIDKFNKDAVVFWAEEIAEKAGFSEEAFSRLAQYGKLDLGYSSLGERFMSEFGAQKYLTLLSENEDRLKYLSDTYAIAGNESDLLKKDGLSEGDIADLILRSPGAAGVEEDTLSFASEFVMSSDVDDGIRDIVVDRVQALPGEQRDKLLNRCYLKFMLQGSLDESFPFSEDELIHAHERVEARKKQDEDQDAPKGFPNGFDGGMAF